MFIERIRTRFNVNEPIFTEELLELFNNESRVQVFRNINAAKQDGSLVQYTKGVYFIPQKTRFGNSTITADDVIRKRYLSAGESVDGLYGGIKLLNSFSVTTQMAGVVEVISNNASAKYREIQINNRRYVLRKSRCKINKKNVAAYTVMQLFTELEKGDKLEAEAMQKLREYVLGNGISREQLFEVAQVFPARSAKLMIGSELFNETI